MCVLTTTTRLTSAGVQGEEVMTIVEHIRLNWDQMPDSPARFEVWHDRVNNITVKFRSDKFIMYYDMPVRYSDRKIFKPYPCYYDKAMTYSFQDGEYYFGEDGNKVI